MLHSTEIHIIGARLVDLHLLAIKVVCVCCDTPTIQRSYSLHLVYVSKCGSFSSDIRSVQEPLS